MRIPFMFASPKLTLLALAALMTLAYGCGDDPVPRPISPVDQFIWEAAWSEATESQRLALKDGELSFAEYEAAALRTVQCVNDAGGMEGEAILNPYSRTYSVGARWQSSGDRGLNEKLRSESDACYAEHFNGINQAWSAMNQPTEQQLIEARAGLAACLREAGLVVPDSPSLQDIQQHREAAAFFGCATKVQQEFGIPNFGG